MRVRAAKLGKSLATFAQDDRRKLAAAFHAAMLREIRDQVYGILVSSSPPSRESENPWVYEKSTHLEWSMP